MLNEFNLLKTRRFLPLFLTQFLGAFNDNLFKNALVILITYHFSHQLDMKSSELTALAAGIFILPFFLFSAIAGQLADKFERSRLVEYTKLAEVCLALIAIFAFYLKSVILLLVVLFLLGAQSTFFGPLKYALLPDFLKEDELIAGNGFIGAGTFLAILLGTILGGISVLLNHGEFYISAFMLTIAIIGWISSRALPKATAPNPRLKINFNLLSETKKIVDYTREHKRLFATILGISWFWLLGSVVLAELPPFVKNELHASSSVVSLFFTLFSIGIGIGSLLCNTLFKGEIETKYIPIAGFFMSLFIFDFCFSSITFENQNAILLTFQAFIHNWHGIKMSIDLLLVSVSAGVYVVPLYASLQNDSPEQHRARVIASNNIVNALLMVIGAILSAILLALGSTVSALFVVVGILNILVSLYLRRLKNLRNKAC